MADTTDASPAATLQRWAADTWRCLRALEVDGLPADRVGVSLKPSTRVAQTSPTNIGAWMWSLVAAREIGFIDAKECGARLHRTLTRLASLPRHDPSGLLANWFDPATGEVLVKRPGRRSRIPQFVSTIDNAWLAMSLHLVANADPTHAGPRAAEFLDTMRLSMAFDADVRPGGLFHGGFSLDAPAARYRAVRGNHLGGGDVWYTAHHFDLLVSESRIATYVGIWRGEIPAASYYATWRSRFGELAPGRGDFSAHHAGVEVPEGAVDYRGMRIVPSWGGSMFEALMPHLFVPEMEWGPDSWGVQHPLYVRAHREYALDEHHWPCWGFSPAADPASRNGYREYGVSAVSLSPHGYPSDVEGARQRGPRAGSAATVADDGVVAPHASFIALQVDPVGALANLQRLERDFNVYGPGGFIDAVAVRSGRSARRYLCVDQAMCFAALANVLADDAMRRYVATPQVEAALRPLMEAERFAATDTRRPGSHSYSPRR